MSDTQPQTGMRRIPLTTESYQHVSQALSSKFLLNMFLEQAPDDARNVAALLPRPGLTTVINVGTGPIHAINDDLPGEIYVVSGTHFYRVYFDPGTGGLLSADLGDIGTPSAGVDPATPFYSIAVSDTAAVVCSPPNAFVSAGGAPVAQITTTWPAYGASSVTHLDGYFVFTGRDAPNFFFITTLGDPTAVDALDFAALDAFPNLVQRVVTLGTDLWFAGLTGWEIWYNSGNADFPFRRRPNGILPRSVANPLSIAKADKSLLWWSNEGRFYRTVGYQEKRISTHAIETSAGTITSAYAYSAYGHVFYIVNTATETLTCDLLTGTWHNASSNADGTGPHRAISCTSNSVPLLGDGLSGALMRADASSYTDMGVAVLRQVVLPPLYPATRRAFCARLEIEMEVGTPHTPDSILLEWSDDGGLTYTGSRLMTIGASAGTRKRVYTTRLGSFRDRVFRLTSQQAMTIYALDADITAGAH